MQFQKLSLKDKTIFDKFLSKENPGLSAYAFSNIFLWQCIYDIFWLKIQGGLCVFFKDRAGCFMYLPPLGIKNDKSAVGKCFEVMDKFNKNPIISRIENVQEDDLDFYKTSGYEVVLGGCDYVCRRESLIELKGDLFKKKRTLINNFVNKYDFRYLPYEEEDKKECIRLYSFWMQERKQNNQDRIYQGLLDDNFSVFKEMFENYDKLNFTGRVIKIDGKIRACTFGYELTKKSFVVLFEVCDLEFKGIAQYIFREFSSELKHQDINIMDDSGLENLKKVKLSYRPYKMVNNFIARRG
ncbi:MAG: phosphatidylglycerol lysyltransferase domain-containing protein [Candidatus Omnitrophica bacterium]|nr:phosphatidylglycerol lysyltransferase domain-containing protein [Candidatus Omnitrophota bacterium]